MTIDDQDIHFKIVSLQYIGILDYIIEWYYPSWFQSEVRAGFPSDGRARGAFAPGPALTALPAAARGGSTHHIHTITKVNILSYRTCTIVMEQIRKRASKSLYD